MKKFTYHGPVTTLTLTPAKFKKDGTVQTDARTEQLFPGKTYSLSDDNPQVRNLIVRGFLTEDQNSKAETPSDPAANQGSKS